MTNDRDALDAAILANPDDDAPRLIFADYLEENGEPERAEYIRKQIELTRYQPDEYEYEQLERQTKRLAKKLEWPPELKFGMNLLDVERGFPATIGCSLADFLEHANMLFDAWPLTTLAANHTGARRADIQMLAESPVLDRLTRLDLAHSDLTDSVLEPLFQSRYVGNLHTLDLSGNDELTSRTLKRVLQAKQLRNLRHLHCDHSNMGTKGLHELAQSPRLRQLETLDFQNAVCAAAGVTKLLSSPHLGPLQSLDLEWNTLGPNGAKAIAQCARLSKLKFLNLDVTEIELKGIEALLTSPHLTQLEVLRVNHVVRADATPPKLFRQPMRLTQLHRLELNSCLNDEVAAALFGPHAFPALRTLSLTGYKQHRVSNPTLITLANNPSFTSLRNLDVSENQITSEGVIALAKAPWLRQLHRLNLSKNRIGDKGAKALLESPCLANIKKIILWDNLLTTAMKAKLRARFRSRVQVTH